jgi:hypothetical protein
MTRTPRRYQIHLMLSGSHTQVVEFLTLEDFQNWYSGVLTAAAPDAFVSVPLADLEQEYLVLRAGSVIGIRVEPIFGSLHDG